MTMKLEILYSSAEETGEIKGLSLEEMENLKNKLLVFFKSIDKIKEEVDTLQISLCSVDSDEMRTLNKQYRSLDEPTDVLSFPLWEEDGVFSPPAGWSTLPLGDIVLCPAYIADHAEAENLHYNSELLLMIIHGALHLVGYDHDTPEKKSAMWSVQEKIHAVCAVDTSNLYEE